MRGRMETRRTRLLLLGACLCGVQACGGGGGSDPLSQTESGVEQYALAVSPDGRSVASGGTYVTTTYSDNYPGYNNYGTTGPSGDNIPGPNPSTPTGPGPVEDIPADNPAANDPNEGQTSSGNTDTSTPPDQSGAGEGDTNRKSRLRAARGGRGGAYSATRVASMRRNTAPASRLAAAATATLATAARGQSLPTVTKKRYVTEDLSGRIWFSNQQNGQKAGGVNLGQIVYALAFSPDGTILASGSQDQRLRLLDAHTGVVLQELRGHGDRVAGVSFSPDGRRIASAGYNDHTVRVWDVASGAPQGVVSTGTAGATAVAFAPDGATLAGGAGDGSVFLWDTSGQVAHLLKGHKYAVFAIAFSPDSKTFASGSADNTVILWDPQAGTPRQTLTGHTGFVFGVRFSPDGKWLATGSADQTVKLWDAHSGALVNTLSAPEQVQAVDFAPDSQTVYAAGVGGNLRAWDVTSGQLRWEQAFR